MPERIGRIEEFDVEGVIIANHHNRILFMLIDQLYFGDSVFDQELPLQRIIVVLDILSVIGLHTLQKALTACLHQLLRLHPNILTEQLIKTLMPLPINLDLIWLISFFLKSDLDEGLCVITIFFIFALELLDIRVYRLTSNKLGCFFGQERSQILLRNRRYDSMQAVETPNTAFQFYFKKLLSACI